MAAAVQFVADLHIHSKYSRATSKECDLEHLAWWAARKGIAVVGTGDFTHPAWIAELREKLVPAEPGLFRLRSDLERDVLARLPTSCRNPVRFLLSVEISTIYKRDDRTRKVHHLLYMPDLAAAERCNATLESIGNIRSDGRPILGLDSRHLLEITLESGSGAYLVPAHVWTPWFAALGSQSGFDAVDDCYADLAHEVFALETGLSSDPAMNWRVSSLDRFQLVSNSDAHSPGALGREATVFDVDLDYFAIRGALRSGQGLVETIEFFPEEGKYHLDGHRKCNVCWEPIQTKAHEGMCSQCGKPVTVGVLHRVEALADRAEGFQRSGAPSFRSLVQLPEIVSEIHGVGPKSKRVSTTVAALVDRFGPELSILQHVPIDDLAQGSPLLAESISRLRAGRVIREGGFDGEYGVIRMFEPGEVERVAGSSALFEMAPEPVPAVLRTTDGTALTVRTAPAVRLTSGPVAGSSTPDVQQRKAVQRLGGPVLIEAGPGSGKTRTLVERFVRLMEGEDIDPARCLLISFTRRACDELRSRLQVELGPRAQDMAVLTFHGLGLRIVRAQVERFGRSRDLRVIGDDERMELLGGDRKALSAMTAMKRAVALHPSAAHASPMVPPTMATYDEALRDRGAVDLDDLLTLPVRLLSSDPGVAEHWRNWFEWIAVDEYQDVDPVQYRLLQLLTTPDSNLCAVGDQRQAIYGFRGADVEHFLRFVDDHPTASVVALSRNYRSRPSIVEAAAQLVAPIADPAAAPFQAMRPEHHDVPIAVSLHEADDPDGEAEYVVRSIERLLGGTSLHSFDVDRADGYETSDLTLADIAVLYRTSAQAEPLLAAFDRAGLPAQRRSHERLSDHAGVQWLMRALRVDVAEGSADAGASGAPVQQVLQDLRSKFRPTRVIGSGSVDATAADQITIDGAVLDEGLELVHNLAEACAGDARRFLDELALGAEIDTWDPRADRISLLTLHASKGLEFAAVFVVGVEDGLLPMHWGAGSSLDDEVLDEERRLLFVGMTRARDRLALSYACRRARRGQLVEVAPSPFLSDIDESMVVRTSNSGTRPFRATGRQLRLL